MNVNEVSEPILTQRMAGQDGNSLAWGLPAHVLGPTPPAVHSGAFPKGHPFGPWGLQKISRLEKKAFLHTAC